MTIAALRVPETSEDKDTMYKPSAYTLARAGNTPVFIPLLSPFYPCFVAFVSSFYPGRF
jgi:hypothetical protein